MTRTRSFYMVAALFLLLADAETALAQAVVITEPTNNPLWTTGNNASVTYAWTGVSMMRIKIVKKDNPNIVYYSNTVTDGSSPAARNFPVPQAVQGTITQCVILAEGLNVMSVKVCGDEKDVEIYHP